MRIIIFSICLTQLDGKLYWSGTSAYQSFIWNEHPHGLPAGDTVIQVINYINHRDLTSGAETFNLDYPWNNQ